MPFRALLDFLEFLDLPPRAHVDALLDRVLTKSRQLTGAEAGSIYIVRRRGSHRELETVRIQNDRIKIRQVRGRVDANSIAGYVALTGKVVRVADVHRIPARAPYRFRGAVDKRLGYRTQSMLAFPLRTGHGDVVGVVQLINRRDRRGRGPLPFTAAHGAVIKPINHFVGGAIERADLLDRVSHQNLELRRRGARIAALQDETEDAFMLSIRLLARAAELHDEDTGNHILRVNEYSWWIARKLGMPERWCDEIRYSAQLHDVGKMSVDAAVLKKKGALGPEERAEMNRHPEYGWRILKDSPRLQMAAEIAWCHHERWDGSGYPRGLRGEAIPLSARIVQLADVYDALRSTRPYKPGFSHEQAVKIIVEGDERIRPERDFDPKLRALFARHHAAFDRVRRRLAD
jgi:hypothetical protein